ncbi:hypothetical protein H6G41_22120 [Tolypothrix sp. FACHB-123]|uniref:HpsJ-like protein, cyanoexosortase A-associated n=1 Tax=Tolypothrix sp. FACHB-123 TaxID=2692868 RepID=UPI00168342A9|nr:HpsJ family protein [Tolypothrix sp. FACHB-123]MBD2357282.1 hypothetical protein [Tolypothrix sp. FACHB-123]
MTPLDKEILIEQIPLLWKSNNNIVRSILTFRLVGYCLLLLFILELGIIFIPPDLMNPAWEFKVFGDLVERIAIPLISLCCIFYGEDNLRSKWERLFLKLTYWFTLLFAIFLLLLTPLGIVNSIRIDRQNTQIYTTQIEQQINQLKQAQAQLAQVKTPVEMEELLRLTQNQVEPLKIQTSQQLEDIKIKFSQYITASINQINATTKKAQANQRLSLIKNTIKWSIGALVSGMWLICIWSRNHWIRQRLF